MSAKYPPGRGSVEDSTTTGACVGAVAERVPWVALWVDPVEPAADEHAVHAATTDASTALRIELVTPLQ